jgi:glycosyltransferase involved in cell wall biosynthesis
MALVVAFQRVAENAHHVSDVLAAGALGLVAFHCARVACRLSPDAPPDEPVDFAGPHRLIETAPSLMTDKPYLSLVIPCYNEEENVPTLLQRVEAALAQTGRMFEVVLVDDGSTDATPKLLAEAMAAKPWLRVLRMAKNGGQSAAFEAGFEAAQGQVIATIDADLQNDPEEIPRLLPMLDEQNVDMITGWRKERQDTPFRRWQSRQANRIRNWISKETVNDSASSLKIYRAQAIRGMRLFNGAHRFFPTLVKMRGYKVYETPVKHSVRFAGTAKYGFRNRALRAFIDLLGVRWMKERSLRYEATEIRPNGE